MKFFALSILKMPVWKVLRKTEPKHKYFAFFGAALISSEQVMNMQVCIVKLCTDWGVLGRCLPIAVGYNEPGEILLGRILYPSLWNIGTFVFLRCKGKYKLFEQNLGFLENKN